MKLTCLPDQLTAALAIVSRAVSTKGVVNPILSCVVLEAGEDGLGLRATDTHTTISATCAAVVDEPGTIAIPARLLADTIGPLTSGEPLAMTQSGKRLQLSCGRFTASLATQDASQAPPVPTVDGPRIMLTAAGLAASIGRVAYAAARDNPRPQLDGVFVSLQDGVLTLTAADGFRAAIDVMTVADAPGVAGAIVPAPAIRLLAALLPDSDELVTLTIGANDLRASAGGVTFTTRLLEGQFPDLRRIIPRAGGSRAVVNAAQLAAASQQALGVYETGPQRLESIRLAIGEGGIVVSTSDPMQGEVETTIDAEITGLLMTINLNGRYLRDALRRCGETAVLDLGGAVSPVVIRSQGGPDGRLGVLMPMHNGRPS